MEGLREYGVDGQLLRAIKSFYCRPEVCVRENGKQSKPFHVGVRLQQGCVLSPLLFTAYMNGIEKYSQADECWKFALEIAKSVVYYLRMIWLAAFFHKI